MKSTRKTLLGNEEYPYEPEWRSRINSHSYAQNSHHCTITETDAVTDDGIDWQRIDMHVFGAPEQRPVPPDRLAETMRYVCEVLNLATDEKLIIFARYLASPPIRLKDLARELHQPPSRIRKKLRKVLAMMRIAPPSFAYSSHLKPINRAPQNNENQ